MGGGMQRAAATRQGKSRARIAELYPKLAFRGVQLPRYRSCHCRFSDATRNQLYLEPLQAAHQALEKALGCDVHAERGLRAKLDPRLLLLQPDATIHGGHLDLR